MHRCIEPQDNLSRALPTFPTLPPTPLCHFWYGASGLKKHWTEASDSPRYSMLPATVCFYSCHCRGIACKELKFCIKDMVCPKRPESPFQSPCLCLCPCQAVPVLRPCQATAPVRGVIFSLLPCLHAALLLPLFPPRLSRSPLPLCTDCAFARRPERLEVGAHACETHAQDTEQCLPAQWGCSPGGATAAASCLPPPAHLAAILQRSERLPYSLFLDRGFSPVCL